MTPSPRTLLIAAALAAACPGAARASAAEAAFRAGQWAAVSTAGRSEATAEALALSARALLIRASYVARSKAEALALIEEAERDVEAALAIDARDRAALMQQSAVIGYRARFSRSAQGGKLSREMLRALTRGYADWPDGWTGLAIWHGESVIAVGPFLARTVLGANLEAMARDFDTAARLDPRSPAIPAWRGLLAVRLHSDAASVVAARQWLLRATQISPRDGYEALLRNHAAEVLALLDRGDAPGARALAQRLAPFGRIES